MNVAAILLISVMTVTSYRSVPSQTKGRGASLHSCQFTSIGQRVHPHGIAVSQEQLWENGGNLNYGDILFVEGYGYKVVNDCMNPRYGKTVPGNRIDIWVATFEEEKAINTQHLHVFKVTDHAVVPPFILSLSKQARSLYKLKIAYVPEYKEKIRKAKKLHEHKLSKPRKKVGK